MDLRAVANWLREDQSWVRCCLHIGLLGRDPGEAEMVVLTLYAGCWRAVRRCS